MKKGTSRTVNLSFLQSDGVTPVDLTGGKVYFTVNSNNSPTSDLSAAFQKTITSFGTPTLGTCSVSILPVDTSALTPGIYYYDAKAIQASGAETSTDTDVFQLKPAITTSIT
jgi:hypothetical protein